MGVRLHVRSCWASESELEVVYELEQTRIQIGRGRGAEVRLPHRAVSVRHATIELDGARYALVDHDTTNGTTVEGVRVVPGRKKPLRDGDRIELGGFSIQFRCGVPVSRPTSGERTSSLARRLAREALAPEERARGPRLTVLNGPREGEWIALPDPPGCLVIGRGDEVDLTLPDEDASRAHAELLVDVGGVTLRDLASKNGTAVGGRPVTERSLADRDEIRIGATLLCFEDAAQGSLDTLDAGEDMAGPIPTLADLKPLPPPPEDEPAGPPPDDEPEVAAPAPAPPPPPTTRISAADTLIYVLAATVFAVSLLALGWLLRG